LKQLGDQPPTPSLGEAGSSLGDSPVLAAVAAAETDTDVVELPAPAPLVRWLDRALRRFA
jgi:hypothetical protein